MSHHVNLINYSHSSWGTLAGRHHSLVCLLIRQSNIVVLIKLILKDNQTSLPSKLS